MLDLGSLDRSVIADLGSDRSHSTATIPRRSASSSMMVHLQVAFIVGLEGELLCRSRRVTSRDLGNGNRMRTRSSERNSFSRWRRRAVSVDLLARPLLCMKRLRSTTSSSSRRASIASRSRSRTSVFRTTSTVPFVCVRRRWMATVVSCQGSDILLATVDRRIRLASLSSRSSWRHVQVLMSRLSRLEHAKHIKGAVGMPVLSRHDTMRRTSRLEV